MIKYKWNKINNDFESKSIHVIQVNQLDKEQFLGVITNF